MLEGATGRLSELGFTGPETYFAGTDFHVSFRRGEVEVSVFSEDMGTTFPHGFVRWPDKSFSHVDVGGTYPDFDGAYPAHSELWATTGWWKRRAVSKRLEPELREEFARRANRVLIAATQIVEKVAPNTGAV